VALARIDRARVAAAHRDDHVGGLDHGPGERLRELPADVDADLAHGLDDRGVQLFRGLAAGRAHLDPPGRELIKEPGRHMAAPGVVYADEQDFRNLVAHFIREPALDGLTTILGIREPALDGNGWRPARDSNPRPSA